MARKRRKKDTPHDAASAQGEAIGLKDAVPTGALTSDLLFEFDPPPTLKVLGRYAGVILAAVYFVLVGLLYPFHDVFEFDPDEGIRLIIARMMSEGHALYGEIWNDQPPLFSYLTLWWCQIFGFSATSGRVLVLFCAAVMIWAIYDMLRLTWGHGAALSAVLLLTVSQRFMRLSVCHMIGLPAIGFAVLCMWALLRWQRDRRLVWLVAAGVFMGCSLMTKAFVGYVLPVFGLWVLLVALTTLKDRGQWWKALIPPAVWSVAVVGFCGLLLLAVVPWSELSQLYASKVSGSHVYAYAARGVLHGGIEADYLIAWLALLGTVLMLLQRRWGLLVLPAWVLAGYVVLYNHSPVWYHYHLLLSIPGCIVAGIGLGDAFSLRWRPRSVLTFVPRVVVRLGGLGLGIALFASVVGGSKTVVEPNATMMDEAHRAVVSVLDGYADRVDTLATDRQMYAFASGLELPPELAVTSLMRIETDPNFIDTFVAEIEQSDAELIAFGRSLVPYSVDIMGRLGDRYAPLFVAERPQGMRVYVRNDVRGDALAVLQAAAAKHPTIGSLQAAAAAELAAAGREREALQSLQAGRQDPYDVTPLRLMADVLMSRGEYEQGFQLLGQATSFALQTKQWSVARHYLWRRATCPEARFRSGTEADQLIEVIRQRAVVETRGDRVVYAAALAAAGRTAEALRVARATLDEAEQKGDALVAELLRTHIAAYEAGRPVVEPVTFPTSLRHGPGLP